MFRLDVLTLPHKDMRYSSAGDWIWNGEHLLIRVSDLGDWRKEALAAIHEAIEALLCRERGISGTLVDAFDMEHEKSGKEGEPGDEVGCCYYSEHQIATGIERILAAELGVDWKQYDEAIEALT